MSPSDTTGSASGSPTGPTVSFGFNLGKVLDHGEDSDPILRDGPDLALLAVFDGMGGAGGTVYETDEGPRSGAYMASRIARDVVERRMLDLLVPDWNLRGEAAAEDLHRSVGDALKERLVELKAPPSRLRSRLLRALPTTMAVLALQRTNRAGSWLCHVFWAGDSRGYVFEADGAHQLTVDDLRDPNDAMANLRHDSVVSNAISADTDFHVNYRKIELRAPFLLVCATDGCFGYLPSPMHFEHLILDSLSHARSVDAWSHAVQTEISAVAGDDASMSVIGVGADLEELQALYAARVAELAEQFTSPMDELNQSVRRAEHELGVQRQRQENETAQLWARYQSGYERYLHAADEAPDNASDEAPDGADDALDADAAPVAEDPSDISERTTAVEPAAPADGTVDREGADDPNKVTS